MKGSRRSRKRGSTASRASWKRCSHLLRSLRAGAQEDLTWFERWRRLAEINLPLEDRMARALMDHAHRLLLARLHLLDGAWGFLGGLVLRVEYGREDVARFARAFGLEPRQLREIEKAAGRLDPDGTGVLSHWVLERMLYATWYTDREIARVFWRAFRRLDARARRAAPDAALERVSREGPGRLAPGLAERAAAVRHLLREVADLEKALASEGEGR